MEKYINYYGVKEFHFKTKSFPVYIVVKPMISDFIDDNMMILNEKVDGQHVTRQFKDLDEALKACKEFNDLYNKWK